MFNLGQQQFFVDIYKKLSKAGLYQIIIVYEDKYIDERIDPNFKNLLFLTHRAYSNIRVDLALHSEIHCHSKFAKTKVFFGHGFPGKHTLWEKKLLLNQDHYFMYGPKDRDIIAYIESKNPGSTSHLQLWEIGFPKYDHDWANIPLNSEFDVIDNNKINVIYAPAWDPGCSLRVYRDELFHIFASCAEYNFIVKLHPVMLIAPDAPHWEFYTGGVDWKAFVKDKCSIIDNVHFYNGSSINILYPQCNYMITDFSGVAIDLLMLQKPVICLDMFEYYAPFLRSLGSDAEESVSNPLFNNGRDASYVINHPNKLFDQLKLLETTDPLSSKREDYADYMLYNRGNSINVMYDAISSLIN